MNCSNGSLQRLHTRDRLDGSEICRSLPIRQMGKYQRFFRQEKGSGTNVTFV